MYYTNYDSIVGKLLIVSDGEYINGLWIYDQKYFCYDYEFSKLKRNDDLEIFKITKSWLDKYFKGLNPNTCELKLNPSGSDFQKLVWNILLEIPYGEVMTYGEICKIIEKRLNKKMSSRAVGNAVSHNKISIIIPCHRVVGKNNISGYAGGIDNKIKLLNLEKCDKKVKSVGKM